MATVPVGHLTRAANWVDIHVLSPINEEFIMATKIVYGHKKNKFKSADEKKMLILSSSLRKRR